MDQLSILINGRPPLENKFLMEQVIEEKLKLISYYLIILLAKWLDSVSNIY